MKKFIFILLMGLCVSAFATPLKTVRFATEATYPPFEYIDESGQIRGFDIDIAKALCQQMQVECTFSNQAFNSLIPSLVLGKYDALIASLGITPERLQQVDFTNSYYEPGAVFVAQLSKHYLLKDIPGLIVGVQQGSTFESYLHHHYGDTITIKAYGSIQDIFLDLESGRVDVVIADTAIARDWLNQGETSQQFGVVEKPVIDHTYFGTGYGIAVSKNNPELLQELNKALVIIKANGTYQKISQQYFGVHSP